MWYAGQKSWLSGESEDVTEYIIFSIETITYEGHSEHRSRSFYQYHILPRAPFNTVRMVIREPEVILSGY